MFTKKRPSIPVFTFLLFGLIALFSTAALEYLKFKQKGSSPTLIPLFEKNRNSPTNKNIEQIIKEQLSSIGVSPESIHKYKDNKDSLHMLIKIPRGKYSTIELPIEDAILANHASVVKKEELYDESIDYFLWKIVGKEDQEIMLLFSCKKDAPKKSTEPETPINKVAVIMDDMGYSLKAISDICSIKKPITISILPFSPFAQETAQIAHKNKLEIILHLPLESNHDKGGNIRTKGIIRSNMNEDEIVKILDTNFSQVPFVNGANNHMGSKITADENHMEIILKYFKAKNFFFIDSVTTGKSTAYEIAQALKIPSAHRHIFLDTEQDEEHIKGKLIDLFILAQKKGTAVGICHPTEETLRVLVKYFHIIDNYDVSAVFASQIVD